MGHGKRQCKGVARVPWNHSTQCALWPMTVAHDHGYCYLQTKDVSGAAFDGASDGGVVSSTRTDQNVKQGDGSILLLRQSCSDRPIFDLIIGVGEKSMGPRRSSSGTSPRPWTPGGMSPRCASSFHYLSLASALGGDTFPHRPPSNFTGAPAGRTAASFASRPNVCQPPRVNIVRPAR